MGKRVRFTRLLCFGLTSHSIPLIGAQSPGSKRAASLVRQASPEHPGSAQKRQ